MHVLKSETTLALRRSVVESSSGGDATAVQTFKSSSSESEPVSELLSMTSIFSGTWCQGMRRKQEQGRVQAVHAEFSLHCSLYQF